MRPNGVAVVVCCYDDRRWEALAAAVESIRAQVPPPDRTIVVVDHNDALLERARAAWPDAPVVPNGGRRGLSSARNTGVEVALDAEVVVFLDDDAVADPGWLARLLEPYRDERVVAAGGTIAARWAERRPAWLPPELDWVVGCTYQGLPTSTAPVRNVIGANMSIRRDALLEAGGFRPELGRVGADSRGCEETELCLRLAVHRPGARILHVPEARVEHHVPRDRASWGYLVRRSFGEGRSKAALTRLGGAGTALATERSYVARTLPVGVARATAEAIRARRPAVLGRIGAIGAAVTVAGAGYATELAAAAVARRRGRSAVAAGSPDSVDCSHA
jgi:GT2 family glycosyltransferase